MKIHFLPVFLLWISGWGHANAQVQLTPKTSVDFATISEAALVLTSSDEFVKALSPFDRSSRLKTDREVSEKEFLKFVGTNLLSWSDLEKQSLTAVLNGIKDVMTSLALPFPQKVLLIKTTGNEEGGAAYTRANAVILPQKDLNQSSSNLKKTIVHELFHVLSRANPKLRDQMYAAIGFVKTGELDFPDHLKARKLTNPDAPLNNHCIRLKIDGNESWAIPILFSSTEKYDINRGGEFFRYLQFRFLKIDHKGTAPTVKPVYSAQNPILAEMIQITGFYEQVGRNTGYILHPEEILADNFVHIVFNTENVASPDLLMKLKAVLAEYRN